MKTKLYLPIVLMFVALTAHTQSIILEFYANHTCTQVELDSIWIQNLTQGGKMVLYYPDNIAVFLVTDIEDIDLQNHHLYVSQNYPNPFSAHTNIDVYLATPDMVSLNVYDLTGHTVVRHEDKLEEGMHRFSFSAGVEKTYILTVTSGKHFEKRIMLQMGAAGSAVSEITYLGSSVDDVPKTMPKSSDFNFNPGDELRFTGFVADFAGNMDYGVMYDAPETSTEYLFDIANTPPAQPSEINGEDSVLAYSIGLVYEVEVIEGLIYLWSVPDGWEITEGQGSHAITVNAGSDAGDISVKAENNCGLSDASVLSVSVYIPDPVANFQFEISPDNFLEVIFTNLSLNAETYIWDFGDGNSSTEENPTHIYSAADTYEVTLTATNADGVSNTYSETIVLEDPNILLTMLAGQTFKTWKLYRVGTSMGVGPNLEHPRDWWSLMNDGSRPCVYYHEFTFHRNGDYVFDDKGFIWGEGGVFHEDLVGECIEAIPANMVGPEGEDLTPWLGGTHAFELNPNTMKVTLTGLGAWIGIMKVGTEGEVTVPQSSVTFEIEIEERDGYDYMHVFFVYDWGVWSFSYAHYHDPSLEPDVVEEQDPIEPLEELTPTEMFNTFASTSAEDVQILVPTESTVELTVGVDDPADPDATKVGEYYRIATDWQELQFATEYYIQFDNFTTVSLDVYLPSSNDYSGPLSKDIAIIIANNHDTPEWWNHHLQYDVDPEEVVLDEWQTFTFQLDAPTSGPGIPNGNPLERGDLNFFAISIGGAGHSVEGTFYIRNFIFDESDDNNIYGDGVTDIDGNEYVTVIIGDQEWMAENLRVTKYKNGDDIPAGLSNAAWESITQGAYAVYPHNSISGLDSDEEVLEAYGALYNWYSVIDARDLCPAGWQVPTDDDWNDLLSYLNDEHGVPNTNTLGGAGNALKSCRQVDSPVGGECDTSEHPRWNSHASNHGFDEFAFAALPGGYRWTSGSYHYVGLSGFYWSMTESSSTSSWGRYLGSGLGNISQVNYLKNVGFSVRCVKTIE